MSRRFEKPERIAYDEEQSFPDHAPPTGWGGDPNTDSWAMSGEPHPDDIRRLEEEGRSRGEAHEILMGAQKDQGPPMHIPDEVLRGRPPEPNLDEFAGELGDALMPQPRRRRFDQHERERQEREGRTADYRDNERYDENGDPRPQTQPASTPARVRPTKVMDPEKIDWDEREREMKEKRAAEKKVPCPECGTKGKTAGGDTCPKCGGKGRIDDWGASVLDALESKTANPFPMPHEDASWTPVEQGISDEYAHPEVGELKKFLGPSAVEKLDSFLGPNRGIGEEPLPQPWDEGSGQNPELPQNQRAIEREDYEAGGYGADPKEGQGYHEGSRWGRVSAGEWGQDQQFPPAAPLNTPAALGDTSPCEACGASVRSFGGQGNRECPQCGHISTGALGRDPYAQQVNPAAQNRIWGKTAEAPPTDDQGWHTLFRRLDDEYDTSPDSPLHHDNRCPLCKEQPQPAQAEHERRNRVTRTALEYLADASMPPEGQIPQHETAMPYVPGVYEDQVAQLDPAAQRTYQLATQQHGTNPAEAYQQALQTHTQMAQRQQEGQNTQGVVEPVIGAISKLEACPSCGGKYPAKLDCPACGGSGVSNEKESKADDVNKNPLAEILDSDFDGYVPSGLVQRVTKLLS